MPSRKTETTELAVACGLLGLHPDELTASEHVLAMFEGTLPADKLLEFVKEFRENTGNRSLYDQMREIGLLLRDREQALRNLKTLSWIGPEQQAAATTMARDLQAGFVAVSVKAESNVIANPSPYNLLEALPTGEYPRTRSGHWYLNIAPVQYEQLYQRARTLTGLENLPESAAVFENKTPGASRKELARGVRRKLKERTEEAVAFAATYQAFSRTISERSAARFNEKLAASKRTRAGRAVFEEIAQTFLRMDSLPYILAGIDKRQPFAVRIPDITSWRKAWKFDITASPDPEAGQPVVRFNFDASSRNSDLRWEGAFHTQIRWSHGKFAGNPEGKLYKDFRWIDVPFLDQLI